MMTNQYIQKKMLLNYVHVNKEIFIIIFSFQIS